MFRVRYVRRQLLPGVLAVDSISQAHKVSTIASRKVIIYKKE
jgi:hypothetical protein